MNMTHLELKTFGKALTIVSACVAIDASAALNPPVRTDADRNATPLSVGLKRIGTLAPRDAKDVGASNWTIDGGPIDRDFVDFDKYCNYLPALGVAKIRVLTGWVRSRPAARFGETRAARVPRTVWPVAT